MKNQLSKESINKLEFVKQKINKENFKYEKFSSKDISLIKKYSETLD